MNNEKLLLTVDECARRLGIGRSHTYLYVLRGDLPSVKLGRSRRITKRSLEEFIARLEAEARYGL